MLTRLVDSALNATFLLVYVLSRLRNHTLPKTPGAREEDRLMGEWIDANRKRLALQAELDQPTASRLYDAQMKLVQATVAAVASCDALVVELRAGRTLRRDSKDPLP